MKKKNMLCILVSMCFFISCLFFWTNTGFAKTSKYQNGQTVFYVPITLKCVKKASQIQKVPLWAIISILSVEGGSIGMVKPNNNGTYDIGPMQINTLWLKKLKKYNINERQLQFNGCLNVHVGAWILKHKLENGKSFLNGVGGYHSFTEKHNKRYSRKILESTTKINDVQAIFDRANDIHRGIKYNVK